MFKNEAGIRAAAHRTARAVEIMEHFSVAVIPPTHGAPCEVVIGTSPERAARIGSVLSSGYVRVKTTHKREEAAAFADALRAELEGPVSRIVQMILEDGVEG